MNRPGFWSHIWRGKSPVRALMNLALMETGEWQGKILDIGGTQKPIPSYRTYLTCASGATITCVNIDAESAPDILADAAQLPLPDASYDQGWCFNLLEHVENPAAVLQEAARVLKPGARLAIFTPFLVRVHGHPNDYARYTDTLLANMVTKAGFHVDHVQGVGGGPFLAAVSQIQAVCPRPIFFVFVGITRLCDRVIARLRPQLRYWPLGFFVMATR